MCGTGCLRESTSGQGSYRGFLRSARTVGTLLPVQTHGRPGGGARACPVPAKASPTSVFCTTSLRSMRKCAEFSGIGETGDSPGARQEGVAGSVGVFGREAQGKSWLRS